MYRSIPTVGTASVWYTIIIKTLDKWQILPTPAKKLMLGLVQTLKESTCCILFLFSNFIFQQNKLVFKGADQKEYHKVGIWVQIKSIECLTLLFPLLLCLDTLKV